MSKFYDSLISVLKEDERFWADDGSFLRNAVYEAGMKMDKKLLHLLLSDEEVKSQLFSSVDEVLVFDKVKFGWTVNNKEFLPDSFTRFKNKIGLADANGDMIAHSGKVELVFPYKDCVLEGGQTSEEQKREEIFYNETLAPDEVDRLLYPKSFCNAKKYTVDGEEKIDKIAGNDNLIIKGNNLLVLASLMKRYEGAIKCIYIDVPYFFWDNKSADTFGYNSNFKLSTWLTFMKDRLILSKKLLRSDGSLWISVGKDGQHYLKILADEIFGHECFAGDVGWQKTYSPRNDSHGISGEIESILVYSKSSSWRPKKLERTAEMDARYKSPDNDPIRWKSSDACAPGAATHQGMVYAIQHPITGEMVYPTAGRCWRYQQDEMLSVMQGWCSYELRDLYDEEARASVCGISPDKVRKGVLGIVLSASLEESKKKAQEVYDRGNWPVLYFTNGGKGGIARKTHLENLEGKPPTNLWMYDDVGHTDEAMKEILGIFDGRAFGTPKPERLIKRILDVATDKNDIVLDFHLGSGTTCAVAQKMNRQYIGVDQMDYIETVAVERLKKNIAGDQNGISEAVGWHGGGSFVYCELAKLNQIFVDEIQAATTAEALKDIYARMEKTGSISCKVNPKDISDNVSEFEELSLDEQKRLLMNLLDMNMLYVNYCDIDDEEYKISDTDKSFTRSFYGESEGE